MRKKLIIVILVIAIIVYASILLVPIKFSTKKSFEYIKSEPIKNNDTQLICDYSDGPEPRWEVIGNKNGLFIRNESAPEPEGIVIKGNFDYRKLNYDVLNCRDNKFILSGKITGEEKIDGGIFKVFDVMRWDILYPIKQPFTFLPKKWLAKFDYMFNSEKF